MGRDGFHAWNFGNNNDLVIRKSNQELVARKRRLEVDWKKMSGRN